MQLQFDQRTSFGIEDEDVLKNRALSYSKSGESDLLFQILNNYPHLRYVNDWIGDSLLSISCWHNQFVTAVMLIEKFDLDVNHRNHQKTTPLHRACSQDNTAIALMLINKGYITICYCKGANVNLKDDSGRLCVDCGSETTKEIINEKIRILKDISSGFRAMMEKKSENWDKFNLSHSIDVSNNADPYTNCNSRYDSSSFSGDDKQGKGRDHLNSPFDFARRISTNMQFMFPVTTSTSSSRSNEKPLDSSQSLVRSYSSSGGGARSSSEVIEDSVNPISSSSSPFRLVRQLSEEIMSMLPNSSSATSPSTGIDSIKHSTSPTKDVRRNSHHSSQSAHSPNDIYETQASPVLSPLQVPSQYSTDSGSQDILSEQNL